MYYEKATSFENAKIKYNGIVEDTFRFVEKTQLLRPELWKRFVQQFREDADFDAGWRGEYWGKMMRGAAMVCAYTGDDELYQILKETILDMIASADDSGRISSYAVSHEFDAWDLWSRKYVLLGMQYFLEVCREADLKDAIIHSMTRQADYIIQRIGDGEGQKPITMATRHWRGLNSSSILEPMVRLYNLTGEKRYFDFAGYIVSCGCTDVENFFELAYRDELYPYQYPVTKAYEMISCFEGLMEYYKITGEETYKTAIVNFANKILESDFTVIGCCGCTCELFDHSTVRQATPSNEEMQETCVTVTVMKFLSRVYLLTGDPKYIDAFEIAFYNAYLGSLNTENVVGTSIEKYLLPETKVVYEPLPFDSYSPLTAGVRGIGIGGFKIMSDNHYYGCCACIGAAGIGLVPQIQFTNTQKGVALNLFVDGTAEILSPGGNSLKWSIATQYPKNGNVRITLTSAIPETFELLIRNPAWSKTTLVSVNGKEIPATAGYISVEKKWRSGDEIELTLDMRTKAIYPIPYGEQVLMNKVIWGHNYVVPTYDKEHPLAYKHIALQRGPVMLAQENRLGYCVDDPVDIVVDENGYVAATESKKTPPYDAIVAMDVPLTDGSAMLLTDYASAGKLWNEESKMAVWMLTK